MNDKELLNKELSCSLFVALIWQYFTVNRMHNKLDRSAKINEYSHDNNEKNVWVESEWLNQLWMHLLWKWVHARALRKEMCN